MKSLTVLEVSPGWVNQKMTVIAKVVGDFCDLACDYCWYHEVDQITPHVMSEALLEKFIREYLEMYDGKLWFVWIGGEPTLAGINFFRKVLELQEKYKRTGHSFDNSIQTNGTHVTKEWGNFFHENNFKVGVSIDATGHDSFRKNKAGRGTLDRVMSGVQILRDCGIEPGFLQVLPKSNLKNLEQDFSFFYETLGTKRWAINVHLGTDKRNIKMVPEVVSKEEWSKYMERYIDLWLEKDDPDVIIREIEYFFAGAMERQAGSCEFNGTCFRYFCLEWDGRIYPCDRLSGRDDCLFGDLSKQSLREILTGEKRQEYAETVSKIHHDCESCEWLPACHNGCSAYRSAGKVDGKYIHCEARKAIFKYFKDKVTQLQTTTEGGD